MSKSTQATNKQSQLQSHSHQEENNSNNKRMISSAKSSACASQHQQQSHHSRTTHEYVNVKNPCRRNSQPVSQNPKPLYRSESVQHRSQMMPSSVVKCRNDHKNDNHQQDFSNDMNRACHESRHNGKPMTDIYADDDLAEVKKKNKQNNS